MKLKVLLIFSLLFYYVDYIAANNNNDDFVNLDGELSSQYHRQHNQAARNVRDTNDPCDPTKLENLNINALAKKANLSEHCSIVAADVFSRRFASDKIQFSNADQDSFDILQYFGHLLTKVSFDLNRKVCRQSEISQFKELLRLINEKSRKSLTEFAIDYNSDCFVDIFEVLLGPFELVDTVSIEFINRAIKTGNLRLNNIFPHVRHLELNIESFINPSFIDGQYQDLEELSVAGPLLNDRFLLETFTNLLEKNKQIRWLSLRNPPYDKLQLASKHLINLEELHIKGSIEEDPSEEEITFPSIKKLTIQLDTNKCSLPKRIKFKPDLEDLTLHCSNSDIDDNYFTFLLTFPQVKNLTAGVEFNKEHFIKFFGIFPKLSKAEFVLRNDVTADDIAEFVKKSDHLNELSFLYLSNPNVSEFLAKLYPHIGEHFIIQFESFPGSNVEFIIKRKVDSGKKMN